MLKIKPFPLSDSKILDIFSFLSNKKRIALAVSGGRDSCALMLLISKWLSIKKINIEVHVLTVNHKLRKDSDSECQQVSEIANAYGFNHQILVWEHKEIKASIQEKAREARYKLMLEYIEENMIDALLTGHTLDDQVETFIMRLSKGSGLDGLRSIQEVRDIDGVLLYRPLLSITRNMTTEILKSSNREWIDDPYNQDQKFERIKIRKNIHHLENLNISSENISKSINRLARSQQAIQHTVNYLFHELVEINYLGYITIKKHKFDQCPEDLAIRIIERCLRIVNGEKRVSLSSLEKVYIDLIRTKKSKTINGCVIKVLKYKYIITREIRDIRFIDLKLGDEIIWDNRFNINLKSGAHSNFTIKNLGRSNNLGESLKNTYFENLPSYIIDSLPGGFIKDKLVLLPNIHNIYSSSNLIVKFISFEERTKI
tara:strand:- start:495 stop:1778 length:1284 start_codon:yes stop_codon:yes gene_type:complete